jgi:hypothetical protein
MAGGSQEHPKMPQNSLWTLRQRQAKKKRRFYAALRQVLISEGLPAAGQKNAALLLGGRHQIGRVVPLYVLLFLELGGDA